MTLKNFLESPECRSRAHCRACLSDPAWRASVGAPADGKCPHGVTLSLLPDPVELPPIGGGCCGGATSPADVQMEMLRRAGKI